MAIQNLKSWHWVLIGIVVGIMAGQAQMLTVSDRPVGGIGFMPQATFEAKLGYPLDMGHPHLQNIIIHPTPALDLVSMSELDTATILYHEKWFAAPRPYVSLKESDRAGVPPDYTVADYLHELAETHPEIKFSTAWWESTAGACALWGTGGALLIGGVWPFLLNFLVGAGFGRQVKDPDYDLDRFSGEADEQADKAELTEEELRHLEELEAEMMAGLAAAAQPAGAQGKVEAPAIRALSSEAVSQGPAESDPDKDFAGEYYPVEKKSPHGFSLVEILVVIGVIAVLLSIALPIIVHARAKSQQVKCASNLGQIGSGLELYSQNYHKLPQVAMPAGLADALKAVNVEGILTCPADPTNGVSYSMNAVYAGMPKSAGDAGEVLAFELAKRHDGKQNVVFFDGHVDER